MHLSGLIAATFTPMSPDGSLSLAMAKPVVDRLIQAGISGLYVCGSTGEGPLLTTDERKKTAAAYVAATGNRLPVVVQVGHSSVVEARDLAAHAQQIGADATSAVAPYYFKPGSVSVLVDCLAEIAGGAPKLPFYYYHIPELSGVNVNIVEFLEKAPAKIPNFAGIKFTTPFINDFQALIAASQGRFDILFGRDEMLIAGLAGGATGAVGSTYNFMSAFYLKIMAAFQRGEVAEATRIQAHVVEIVNILLRYRGHAGLKAAMGLIGLDCGPTRLPILTLKTDEIESLRCELDAAGFFQNS
jgi:N-acetylneuraminate lyase